MFLRYHFFWRVVFLLIDLFFLNLSIFLASYLTFNGQWVTLMSFFGNYSLVFNLIWFLLVYWRDYYNTTFKFIQITRDTFEIILFHVFFTLIFLFTRREVAGPRTFILYFYLFFFSLILFYRYLFLFLHTSFGFFASDKRRVAIIGNGTLAQEAKKYFMQPDSGYHFVGFFDDLHDGSDTYTDLSSVQEYMKFAKANEIQEIYSTILPASSEMLQNLVNEAEKILIRVKFIPDFNLMFYRNVTLSMEHNIPVISFRNEPLEFIQNRIAKRFFDLAFSLLLCVTLFWWLIPILALIVKLTSKGPVFFVQKRSGRNGEEFNCFKFRTMYVNELANKVHAQKNDPRVTPVGRFLRKTSLDELPQFFNVILGDMSVVGPRPHMLKHTEEYRKLISKFMVRHYLKPGITGWAQVHGFRGDLDKEKMQKRVEYDIWYLENWSFLLDFKIVLGTIFVSFVKGDKNAY